MRLGNNRGFTLLEVMVAIAMLALISAPLLQIFVTSARVGQRSYDIDKANAATVQTIEKIKGASLKALTGDESNFHDEGDGKYTRTEYYTANWAGPNEAIPGETAPFRAEIMLHSDITSIVEQSYIAQLGEAEGNGYYLEADYGRMNSGAVYTVGVSKNEDGSYQIASSAILRRSTEGPEMVSVTLTIPQADCSGVLPIVVDASKDIEKQVNLRVDNQTDLEVALYIYGDMGGERIKPVLADGTMGNMSVSRMSVSSETLEFSKLRLSVRMIRTEDNQELTNYTTMLYFAG